jgi:hypothetical protein
LNNDSIGDAGLVGVVIALVRGDGSFVSTTLTDSGGNYEFCGLAAGPYRVLEFNLDGYVDVSDTDGSNDNLIRVQLGEGEKSLDRDFVDERLPSTSAPTPTSGTSVPTSGSPAATAVPTTGAPGATAVPTFIPSTGQPVASPGPSARPFGCISGSVLDDTNIDDVGDIGLAEVGIALFLRNGFLVATTLTDSDGNYEFCSLSVSSFRLFEFNLEGFIDVSDTDGANDNRIRVDLGLGENSPGHDFVDKRVPLTSSPTAVSATSSPTDAPVSTAIPSTGAPDSTSVPTPGSPSDTRVPTSAAPVPGPFSSLAPSSSIAPSQECFERVVIDFSSSGNGTQLRKGDYVGSDWLDRYGLTVSAFATISGYAPGNMARIFDTSNPGRGDADLGSPHR